jgi:ABC-type transport system involved in cytochrome bd biosynthesis fused ATPase/permease subunit
LDKITTKQIKQVKQKEKEEKCAKKSTDVVVETRQAIERIIKAYTICIILICSSSNSEMGEIFHQNVQASL